MTWIAVAALAVVILVTLGFACAVSTPRRPASDATYTTNAMIAAGATTVAALCAILATILAATS